MALSRELREAIIAHIIENRTVKFDSLSDNELMANIQRERKLVKRIEEETGKTAKELGLFGS